MHPIRCVNHIPLTKSKEWVTSFYAFLSSSVLSVKSAVLSPLRIVPSSLYYTPSPNVTLENTGCLNVTTSSLQFTKITSCSPKIVSPQTLQIVIGSLDNLWFAFIKASYIIPSIISSLLSAPMMSHILFPTFWFLGLAIA